jgi:quinol monooxygenase YgiN
MGRILLDLDAVRANRLWFGRLRGPLGGGAGQPIGRASMSELVLVVNIKIKPENVGKFMTEVLANARAARAEPGCKQFEVLVDKDDPTKVMLYEIYKDDAAFETHQQTPHFKHYVEHAVPLLASRARTFMRRAG